MVTLVIFLIAIMKLSKVFFALEGVGENFERQRTHRSIVLLHLPRRQVGGSHQVRDLPHSGTKKGKTLKMHKKKLLQKSLVCLDRCHLHRSFPLCPRPVQDPQGQVMRIEATNDYVFQNLFFTTGHISTGF